MKVLVCGGRDYTNADYVYNVLDDIKDKVTEIIQGGAKGADTLAKEWAESRGIASIITYRAQWDKYGAAAGPIRNEDMLKYGQPDLVIAFPGGSGTRHMIKIAVKAGIKTIVLSDKDYD